MEEDNINYLGWVLKALYCHSHFSQSVDGIALAALSAAG
jgi:hypothetical protein